MKDIETTVEQFQIVSKGGYPSKRQFFFVRVRN